MNDRMILTVKFEFQAFYLKQLFELLLYLTLALTGGHFSYMHL